MKIIELDQSTTEWHSWRADGIGASDISVIMSSSPYKTEYQLWEEKCGFKSPEQLNAAMKHGVKNEDKARQWMNSHFKFNLSPLCVEDDALDFFKGSLDGYDAASETLVEIKCPITEKTLDRALLQQAVHDYWYDQVQWQIMLCKPKRAILALWDYRNNNCITVEIMADNSRIKEMRERGATFWKNVQLGKAPKMENKDHEEIENDELSMLLSEYSDMCEREKAATKVKNDLKKKIISFSNGNSFTCNGYTITKSSDRSTLDIEQMKLDGIDVEKYKKVSEASSYTIRCPK